MHCTCTCAWCAMRVSRNTEFWMHPCFLTLSPFPSGARQFSSVKLQRWDLYDTNTALMNTYPNATSALCVYRCVLCIKRVCRWRDMRDAIWLNVSIWFDCVVTVLSLGHIFESLLRQGSSLFESTAEPVGPWVWFAWYADSLGSQLATTSIRKLPLLTYLTWKRVKSG